MIDKLDKITDFISSHHVLSLATSYLDSVSVCSAFYAYHPSSTSFVIASDDETLHIQNIKQNNKVAGNIFLQTREVSKIQGVQFQGKCTVLEDDELAQLYFKTFEYAQQMQPKLWQIKVNYFKMTDNQEEFGKKLIWP